MPKLDDDELEGMSGDELRAALKKLSTRSMNFAFGFKDPKTPILLLHATKTSRALAAELKTKAKAKKTASGAARADGKSLVLDVDGPPMSGMGRMVKALLKKERVSAFTDTRVTVGGAEEEDDGDDAPDDDVAAAPPAPPPTAARGPATSKAGGKVRRDVAIVERARPRIGEDDLSEAPVATRSGNSARRGGTFGRGTTDEGEDVELLSGDIESRDDGASASGFVAQRKTENQTDTLGEFEVEADENGGKVDVTAFRRRRNLAKTFGLPGNVVADGEVKVGSASASKSFKDDGVELGAQANLAEGSVTLGTRGTKRADGSDSDRDETARVGLSAGPGFAGRVHFTDDDNDGNPEIGIGADAGFLTFDVKSEDPLRMAGTILAAPGASVLPSAVNALDDSNMTKDTLGSPQEGIDAFKSLAAGAKEFLGGEDD
jgi:hypothetical protein